MLAWTIYVSFLGVAVLMLLPASKAGMARGIALATAILGLAHGIGGIFSHPGGLQTIVRLPWIPDLGIEFNLGADGISLTLVLLTGIAAVVGILFSWNIAERQREFFAFYLALIGGVYGVFLSFDLFLLFVFYELAIIPKYFLIAIWGSTNREYGAMKLALYSFIGSAMVLIGIVSAYVVAGSKTMNLLELSQYPFPAHFQHWAFPLVFIGFAILAGLWPFHTWAPTGHVAAPTAASMLLAGVVMKLGAYGALRVAMTLFPLGLAWWRNEIALLAVIGIVYGAMVALVQKDFKFVIGYSSVSHMGFVLLGLMTINTIGLSGAVLQMFSHGIIAGLLFAVVGRMVYDRTHTRDLGLLETMNLSKTLPFAAGIFALAAFASMGLPGFSGFAAELQIIIGAWFAFPVYALLAGLGILIGVAYTLRVLQKSFFSEPVPAETHEAHPLPPISVPERLGAFILIATTIAIGIYPNALLRMISDSFTSPLFEGLKEGRRILNYAELLGRVAPETIVAVTALIVLAIDLLVMREEPLRNRFWVCTAFATLGCIVAGAWMLTINVPVAVSAGLPPTLGGMFTDDPLTRLVKVALLVLTICTMVISVEGKFTDHVGEFLSLILMATVGMMLLASSMDLLMIFIALELTSLSLYILTAFNKQNIKSAEAALKYFLFGGMSAAFTLFGLSLVYGLSGTTNLTRIAASLTAENGLDPLLLTAMVMTAIGFGFKIAAVPFHLWAPDAYEGAPTASAALIASGSKLASFFIFAKVMIVAFAHANGSAAWRQFAQGWLPALAILAALSMMLGNLAAIVQSNVKRLLAYSAIAHSGYALLGLLANSPHGVSALIFYMITYGLTVVGAFGVVAVVEEKAGGSSIADFAGLCKREPVLSLCMMVFMLSLAGIPPLAGFFGKFYLFTAAAGGAQNLGLLWLVIFAIAMSAVSLYYYLQVLKQIYVVPASAGQGEIHTPLSSRIVLCALAIGVVALGCVPNFLLSRLLAAIPAFGF